MSFVRKVILSPALCMLQEVPDIRRIKWTQKWIPRYFYQHIYVPMLYCFVRAPACLSFVQLASCLSVCLSVCFLCLLIICTILNFVHSPHPSLFPSLLDHLLSSFFSLPPPSLSLRINIAGDQNKAARFSYHVHKTKL